MRSKAELAFQLSKKIYQTSRFTCIIIPALHVKNSIKISIKHINPVLLAAEHSLQLKIALDQQKKSELDVICHFTPLTFISFGFSSLSCLFSSYQIHDSPPIPLNLI